MKKNSILDADSVDFGKAVLPDQMLMQVTGGCPVPTVFIWNGIFGQDESQRWDPERAMFYPVPNPPPPRPSGLDD
jgi:hypothetical protein